MNLKPGHLVFGLAPFLLKRMLNYSSCRDGGGMAFMYDVVFLSGVLESPWLAEVPLAIPAGKCVPSTGSSLALYPCLSTLMALLWLLLLRLGGCCDLLLEYHIEVMPIFQQSENTALWVAQCPMDTVGAAGWGCDSVSGRAALVWYCLEGLTISWTLGL